MEDSSYKIRVNGFIGICYFTNNTIYFIRCVGYKDMKIILKAYNMLNSTKTWQEDFDEAFGVYWSNYKNTLYRCNPNDILDRPSIINSEDIKQFISDLITQTREETIRDIQGKEIEIQNILEPYFVVLDGRDNEPAQETIIEISKKILELLNKLKK